MSPVLPPLESVGILGLDHLAWRAYAFQTVGGHGQRLASMVLAVCNTAASLPMNTSVNVKQKASVNDPFELQSWHHK